MTFSCENKSTPTRKRSVPYQRSTKKKHSITQKGQSRQNDRTHRSPTCSNDPQKYNTTSSSLYVRSCYKYTKCKCRRTTRGTRLYESRSQPQTGTVAATLATGPIQARTVPNNWHRTEAPPIPSPVSSFQHQLKSTPKHHSGEVVVTRRPSRVSKDDIVVLQIDLWRGAR